MGIQVHWDEQESDILVFDLRAQWTWDEAHTTIQSGLEMINSTAYPVYVMTLTDHGFPPSPSILNEFQKVARVLPPHVMLVVVVTDNFMVETINQIFYRVSPTGHRIGRLAKTPDAARAMIAEHRATRDAAS